MPWLDTLPAGAGFQRPLLAVALLAPWLVLALLCWQRSQALAWRLLPWSPLAALLAALLVADGQWLVADPRLTGGRFGLDPINRPLLLLSALLWWLGGWFARGWLAGRVGRNRFAGFHLLAMAANLGLVLAQDLLTFYALFVVMGLAAYGLIVHSGGTAARRAGRVYMFLLIGGEVCLFTAVALSAVQLQDLRFSAMAAVSPTPLSPLAMVLFALGFGIKLGVLGVHAWLPLAHPAAPLPASAVLSGAMIKTGLLGWLRVAPADGMLAQWSEALIALGLAAAFYGVLIGLTRSQPKTVLAYSSVSQMGLVTVLIGAGLRHPEAAAAALTALLLFVLHHGLAKGALFLGIGVIGTASAAWRPLALLILLLPALALAGAPGSSGMLAKLALTEAVDAAALPGALKVLLSLSATATTLLMARLLYLLGDHRNAPRPGQAGPLWPLWPPWLMLTLAALLAPWLWASGTPLFRAAWLPQHLLAAAWPIALGVLLVAAWRLEVVCRLCRRSPRLTGKQQWFQHARRHLGRIPWRPLLARLERTLQGWPTIGKLLLILLLGFLLALRA